MRNKVIITGFRFDSNFKCPYCNESDRKAAEYERRGNLSSKQRENLDKYYEKSAKARKNLH